MRSRLTHSFGGMRRYMQMSRVDVFIYVEGRDLDPDIYSRVCGSVCLDAQRDYEIVIADRITGAAGGKEILTQFFEFLSHNGALLDKSQPNTKLAMFYLDKDVDDVLGKARRSPHIVYTEYYCLENYLFVYGNLLSSLATAGSIDLRLISGRIPDPKAWRDRVTNSWRDWVALCLLAGKLSLPSIAGYRLATSPINNPLDGPTDVTQLHRYIAQMESNSHLTHGAFQSKVRSAYRLVNAVYARGIYDKIFKGKWYFALAIRELELAAGSHPYNQNRATDRLVGSLIASTDFEGAWAEHFKKPLRTALAQF